MRDAKTGIQFRQRLDNALHNLRFTFYIALKRLRGQKAPGAVGAPGDHVELGFGLRRHADGEGGGLGHRVVSCKRVTRCNTFYPARHRHLPPPLRLV